jgi:hypothetical protein
MAQVGGGIGVGEVELDGNNREVGGRVGLVVGISKLCDTEAGDHVGIKVGLDWGAKLDASKLETFVDCSRNIPA